MIVNRFLHIFCLGLGLTLVLSGCQGRRLKVHYEVLPAQDEVFVPVSNPKPVSTSLHQAILGDSSSSEPVDEGSEPSQGVPIPIQVRVELAAPYKVQIRLKNQEGKVFGDIYSEDGLGIHKTFKYLKPESYRLTVTSEPFGDRYPLFQDVIELDRTQPPLVHLGLLSLVLPDSQQDRLLDSMDWRLVEMPDEKEIFRGKLRRFFVETTFGDKMPGKLILPLRPYSFRLIDPQPQDEVHILTERGFKASSGVPIPLDFSRATPALEIDLRSLVHVGSWTEPREQAEVIQEPWHSDGW